MSPLLKSYAQKVPCPDEYLKSKVTGFYAVELTLGPKPWNGLVASAGFIYYLHHVKKLRDLRFPTLCLKGNLDYATDQLYDINHHAYVAGVTAGVIPIHVFKKIFPSVSAGGLVSYDKLARESEVPSGVASQLTGFKAGFSVGAEILVFLSSPRLCLVGNCSQRFMYGKNWGDARVYSGIGIRYHFSDMSRYTTTEKARILKDNSSTSARSRKRKK